MRAELLNAQIRPMSTVLQNKRLATEYPETAGYPFTNSSGNLESLLIKNIEVDCFRVCERKLLFVNKLRETSNNKAVLFN